MNEKPDIFVFFANARESRILSPRKQGKNDDYPSSCPIDHHTYHHIVAL
jgi:hypothetical protein